MKSFVKALFLDRDGVINKDHGYVYQIQSFDFIDGIFDLTREAINNRYKIIVVTNQSGIGRGFYTESQFKKLNVWMCSRFEIENVKIDKVYFCSSHPTFGIGKYKVDDYRRKPKPGMFFDAQKDLNINLNQSILIGDKMSDMKAGINAGIGTRLLFSTRKEIISNKNNNLFKKITSLTEAKLYL